MSAPLKEGQVKVATGGAPGKGEKKRFLELQQGSLKVWEDKKKKAVAAELALSGATVEAVGEKKKRHVALTLGSGDVHYLHPDDKELDAWVSALRNAALDESSKVTQADFELMTVIGQGSFGKVMQVKKKDSGEIFAMKVLSKKHIVANGEVEHTKAERSILERLNHPFLVNMMYSFQSDDKLFFILEFVNGGELFHHLQKDKRFAEERVQLYAAEILLAIAYLHAEGVVYRDLKPENILITASGHLKLTDFGLCKEGMERETDRTGTFCGTPEYLAPEVLTGAGYTKAVDWWSYGSLVYEMLAGLPPFYSQDVQEMYRKIVSETLKFPDTMSEAAKTFLTDLLTRDLKLRLTDPEKMKGYDFFKSGESSKRVDIDWEKLYAREIEPPFVPDVKSAADTNQISEEFKTETPNLDLDDEDAATEGNDAFGGFTFVEGKKLG